MAENLDIRNWSNKHLVECAEDNDNICEAMFVKQQQGRRVEREVREAKEVWNVEEACKAEAVHKAEEVRKTVEEACCKKAKKVAKKRVSIFVVC